MDPAEQHRDGLHTQKWRLVYRGPGVPSIEKFAHTGYSAPADTTPTDPYDYEMATNDYFVRMNHSERLDFLRTHVADYSHE